MGRVASEFAKPELRHGSEPVAGLQWRGLVVAALEGEGDDVSFERGEPEPFDLLVVDVTMPEMTGEEFVNRQRSARNPSALRLC